MFHVSEKPVCTWRRLFLALSISLIVLGPAEAQKRVLQVPPGRYSFRNYGPEEGLFNQATWDVAQDQAGFIWVGTEQGVFRYDGNRFKGFSMADGLPSLYANHLLMDSKGTLWVGTYAGLAKYEAGRFVAPDVDPSVATATILGMVQDYQGRLWVGTPRGPFAALGQGRLTPLPNWTAGAVTALASSTKAPLVWMAAQGPEKSRLLAWTESTLGETRLPEPLAHERIDALALDGQGILWIRTLASLWSLEPGQTTVKPASPPVPPSAQVASLRTDQEGHLVVPTIDGIYRRAGKGWTHIGQSEGLQRGTIQNIYEDREGSLWICSVGLQRMEGRGMWRAYGTDQGLPSDTIWSVRKGPNGDLLVGTDHGLAHSTGTGFKSISALGGYQIRSMVLAPDGTLFTAGIPPDILHWDPRTRKVQRYGPRDGVISQGRIFRILLDHQGTLWVGTEGGGVLRGQKQGDRWHFTREELPMGSPNESVRDLIEDAGGRIWASGEHGLAIREKGKWWRFTTADGLAANYLAYLCARKNGEVTVAYFEIPILTRVHFQDGHLQIISHVGEKEGLTSGKVYFLGEDDRQFLWVGTGRGVDVLHPDGAVEHFGREDGLVGEDMDAQAFFQDPGGDVWVGSSSGLGRFDMGAHKNASKVPRPILVQALFGDQEVPLDGAPPRMPHSRNTLDVRFSTLSFAREAAIQHQTRLLGLDDTWRTPEGRRQLFPGLTPGKYTFEVRSRIVGTSWSSPTQFSFEVLPAWWQRPWARAAGLLGLALVVSSLFWWRLAALRRRNRILKSMVEARTREVQVKAQELERANEALRNQSMTDPLTGLRNRRFISEVLSDDIAALVKKKQFLLKTQASRRRQADRFVYGILMIDIDHFKTINDLHGHDVGDKWLVSLGNIMRANTRGDDVVIRFGGEEFLVILKNTDPQALGAFSLKFKGQLATIDARMGNPELKRSCSIGVAQFPFFEDQPALLSFEETIMLADLGLYYAKNNGRDMTVHVVADDRQQPSIEDIKVMTSSLEYGIERGFYKIVPSR